MQGAFAFTGGGGFNVHSFCLVKFLHNNLIHLRFVEARWNVVASFPPICVTDGFSLISTRHWIRHFSRLVLKLAAKFPLNKKSVPIDGQLAIFREHCITHSWLDFDNSIRASLFFLHQQQRKFSLSISTCFLTATLKVFKLFVNLTE